MINKKDFFIIIIIYILFNITFWMPSFNVLPSPTRIWLYFIIRDIFITCTAGYMEKYCTESPDRLCRAMKKAFYNIKISSLFGLQAVVSISILDINLNENNYALIVPLYAIVLLFYVIIAMWYCIKILCDNYYIIKYIILKLFHNK
jgi:hypothetical protein